MSARATVVMSLHAVSAETGAPLGAADWQIADETGAVVAEGERSDPFDIDLPPGEYRVAATAPGHSGEMALTVRPDIGQRVAVPLTENRPEASLEAPETAPAGGGLDVGWSGPDAEGDRITLASPGAAAGETLAVTLTRNGSPVTLRLPDETGTFELRYEQYEPQRILATRAITLIATEADVAAKHEGPFGHVRLDREHAGVHRCGLHEIIAQFPVATPHRDEFGLHPVGGDVEPVAHPIVDDLENVPVDTHRCTDASGGLGPGTFKQRSDAPQVEFVGAPRCLGTDLVRYGDVLLGRSRRGGHDKQGGKRCADHSIAPMVTSARAIMRPEAPTR